MKTKIKIEKEVDLIHLVVKAEVRYWEDSEINGESDTENGDNVPCKFGNIWTPHIEIDSGRILNWNKGTKAEIHYKVADCCGWYIVGNDGETALSAEDGYVPDTLCPKESGYGDYIIMDIDEDGFIQDWKFNIDDFMKEEN